MLRDVNISSCAVIINIPIKFELHLELQMKTITSGPIYARVLET